MITRVADSRIAYPTAHIEGRLLLRNGCLVINKAVVFWPAETTWDARNRKVAFGGEFRGASSVTVNAHFAGGGGTWQATDDLAGVLDEQAEAAVRHCMIRTAITSATFVWPDLP